MRHPLVMPPSCLLSSCHAGCLLHHLSSSSHSHCATVSLSHCTGWLLHCLSSCRPLVVLSLHHPLVVLHLLVAVLPLVAPTSCPLVAHRLVVTWPPSNNAATIERPRHRCHYCRSRCWWRHRHHRCQLPRLQPLTEKEAAALPPPAYQQQHHREHVYKSRQIGLI